MAQTGLGWAARSGVAVRVPLLLHHASGDTHGPERHRGGPRIRHQHPSGGARPGGCACGGSAAGCIGCWGLPAQRSCGRRPIVAGEHLHLIMYYCYNYILFLTEEARCIRRQAACYGCQDPAPCMMNESLRMHRCRDAVHSFGKTVHVSPGAWLLVSGVFNSNKSCALRCILNIALFW